jgi:phosphoserine / homoserine phosphotransferase
MHIVCSDLEGVFVPEVWINVAEKIGIKELRLTTRDISDYNVLMKKRLSILKENHLKLKDITDVIATMEPLEGAVEFLDWLRTCVPVIIVSDTFVQFADPLMEKLGRPTLFCHSLTVERDGTVSDYNLRQPDAKRKTVLSLKLMDYKIIAMGDSYNDTNMLKEADTGILFRPPENVIDEFPQFPVTHDFAELKRMIEKTLDE